MPNLRTKSISSATPAVQPTSSCPSKCHTVLSSCIMFACSDGLKLPPAALQCHAVVVAVATLMQMSADPTVVSAD